MGTPNIKTPSKFLNINVTPESKSRLADYECRVTTKDFLLTHGPESIKHKADEKPKRSPTHGCDVEDLCNGKRQHSVLKQNPLLIIKQCIARAREHKSAQYQLMIAIFSGELEAHEEDERHQTNDWNAFQYCRQRVALEELK